MTTLSLLQHPETEVRMRASASGPLELTNLFIDLDTLITHLWAQLGAAADLPVGARDRHLLDAFLLGAGADQVTEDWLHRLPGPVEPIIRRLRRGPRLSRRLAAALASPAARAVSLGKRQRRVLDAWSTCLHDLVSDLAHLVAVPGGSREEGDSCSDLEPMIARAGALRELSSDLPLALRNEVLRLPDCFRAFDQRSEDCGRLAAKLAKRWPPPDRSLTVVGVRSSGSYLAPLLAAYLEGHGYRRVEWTTHRPDQPWRPDERRRLRQRAGGGDAVLLVDDPPVTGSKLASSARALEGLGFPSHAVVIMVALLGEANALPPRLAGRQLVVLPWREWSCHDQLSVEAVSRVVRGLVRDQRTVVAAAGGLVEVAAIESVERATLPPVRELIDRPLCRSHLRARFIIGFRDPKGVSREIEADVRGTGLGYLGRCSAATARALEGLVPAVLGWDGGLLFTQAPLDGLGAGAGGPVGEEAFAREVAAHVLERASRLTVDEDMSLRLRGRRPVWELASDLLLGPFGPFRPALGPVMRRICRRVFAAEDPTVVDGNMGASNWFPAPASPDRPSTTLIKTGYDERAFSVWDHACYDAVWDLAVAAADQTLRSVRRTGDSHTKDTQTIDAAFLEAGRRGGLSPDPERWLVFQVLYLLSVQRHLRRLAREGVGQLQTQQGEPPDHPGVQEAGFSDEVTAWTEACATSIDDLRRRDLSVPDAAGYGPFSLALQDLLVGALRDRPLRSARGLVRAVRPVRPRRGRPVAEEPGVTSSRALEGGGDA